MNKFLKSLNLFKKNDSNTLNLSDNKSTNTDELAELKEKIFNITNKSIDIIYTILYTYNQISGLTSNNLLSKTNINSSENFNIEHGFYGKSNAVFFISKWEQVRVELHLDKFITHFEISLGANKIKLLEYRQANKHTQLEINETVVNSRLYINKLLEHYDSFLDNIKSILIEQNSDEFNLFKDKSVSECIHITEQLHNQKVIELLPKQLLSEITKDTLEQNLSEKTDNFKKRKI